MADWHGRWRTRIVRRLPVVGWRDAKLAERTQQVAQLRARLRRIERQGRRDQREMVRLLTRIKSLERLVDKDGLHWSRPITASLGRHLVGLRRSVGVLSEMDPEFVHPMRQIPFKLRNYRLAASHGFDTPDVLDVWSNADQIDLEEMPEKFVLKSDTGAGGRGVLPLERVGNDTFRFIGTDTEFDSAAISARLRGQQRIGGPFFAEDFLPPSGESSEPLPDDVKVYTCYGEVAQILLMRREPRLGAAPIVRSRYLNPAGECLGEDVAPRVDIDTGIPVPDNLAEILNVARHLSRAVGVQFSRVDLYSVSGKVVLGEITRGPGGYQWYRPDHDEAMGTLLDSAQWRLEMDIIAGRPPGILHGMREAPSLYPSEHISHQENAGTWAIHRERCGTWC